MILSFKKQFLPKIVGGSKIHTIREDDPNRWWPGREIHFATGVRTKDYNCFRMGVCKNVQEFEVQWEYGDSFSIRIGNRELKESEWDQLAKNDGFDSIEEMMEWFNKDFQGKIIHWTDFKY